MNGLVRDHGATQVIADRPLAAKIEALAGYGISACDIARVVGIDEAELGEAYAGELAAGGIKANARVAENLFRKATGDGREAVVAAIFWLKTRARWRESHREEEVVVDRTDRLGDLMRQIAAEGRHIHDRR